MRLEIRIGQHTVPCACIQVDNHLFPIGCPLYKLTSGNTATQIGRSIKRKAVLCLGNKKSFIFKVNMQFPKGIHKVHTHNHIQVAHIRIDTIHSGRNVHDEERHIVHLHISHTKFTGNSKTSLLFSYTGKSGANIIHIHTKSLGCLGTNNIDSCTSIKDNILRLTESLSAP